MSEPITEKEAIKILGEDRYYSLCESIAIRVSRTEEFKNSDGPLFVENAVFDFQENGWGVIQSVINMESLPLIDFHIASFRFAKNKEEAIDCLLDFRNEANAKGANVSFRSIT